VVNTLEKYAACRESNGEGLSKNFHSSSSSVVLEVIASIIDHTSLDNISHEIHVYLWRRRSQVNHTIIQSAKGNDIKAMTYFAFSVS
jgi:hypothetical protein